MAEWLTPLARKANASIGLEDMGSNPIRIKFFTQVKFSNSNRIFSIYLSVRKPAHDYQNQKQSLLVYCILLFFRIHVSEKR